MALALRQLNAIHKKGHKVFVKFKVLTQNIVKQKNRRNKRQNRLKSKEMCISYKRPSADLVYVSVLCYIIDLLLCEKIDTQQS